MSCLLLRLQAPMQSWGVSSYFTERDTAREPSKSGVIGLICAALGRGRDADLSDLAELRMGVRVDRENPEISNRYYIADAIFLVGLEGNEDLLREIHTALKNPHWTLYLGRKAFPPSKPVYLDDGLSDKCLMDALAHYPDLGQGDGEVKRLVIETDEGQFLRSDVPINFRNRRFATRRIQMDSVTVSKEQEG